MSEIHLPPDDTPPQPKTISATVWIVDREGNISSDTITKSGGGAYDMTLVYECGPSQICAKLNDDHTVADVYYAPYGIDTIGAHWFWMESEAKAYRALFLSQRKKDDAKKEENMTFAERDILLAAEKLDRAIGTACAWWGMLPDVLERASKSSNAVIQHYKDKYPKQVAALFS